MQKVKESMAREVTVYINEKEMEAKITAEKKAKELIVTSMQRYAADIASDQTVTVVSLPNEDMKGRLIGREGRNIRTIEAVTGVDLIIDDTPEAVVLSSFDPLRREIARVMLETLIKDGRVHPTRIEEVYDKVAKEMKEQIMVRLAALHEQQHEEVETRHGVGKAGRAACARRHPGHRHPPDRRHSGNAHHAGAGLPRLYGAAHPHQRAIVSAHLDDPRLPRHGMDESRVMQSAVPAPQASGTVLFCPFLRGVIVHLAGFPYRNLSVLHTKTSVRPPIYTISQSDENKHCI